MGHPVEKSENSIPSGKWKPCLKTGARLALTNVELPVKCDSPKLFGLWSSLGGGGGAGGSETQERVLDKHDNIRIEKPAEKYTRIIFAASC